MPDGSAICFQLPDWCQNDFHYESKVVDILRLQVCYSKLVIMIVLPSHSKSVAHTLFVNLTLQSVKLAYSVCWVTAVHAWFDFNLVHSIFFSAFSHSIQTKSAGQASTFLLSLVSGYGHILLFWIVSSSFTICHCGFILNMHLKKSFYQILVMASVLLCLSAKLCLKA